jgi:flagellin-like protein
MRRFRGDVRGLAEIVGTLMLVVIVVAAAVAFSIFVSTYQAQLQSQEAYQHDQALESVHILSIAPDVNATGVYQSLNFTMAAEDVNPSTITGIEINSDPVVLCNVTALQLNQTPVKLTTVTLTAGENFVLTPGDQASVEINFTHGFAYPLPLTSANYVKIELFTAYLNDFTRVFIPPAAIILVDTNVLGSTITTILDGSQSVQPEGNATIVSWNWTVTKVPNATTPLVHTNYIGEVAQTNPALSGAVYWIDLTVTNSDDLTGFDNITYNPG